MFTMLAMVGAAWSCAGDAATAESSIAPSELADRISAEAAPFILDVRTAEEFASGHIPGAVNVPHTELADRLSALELPLGGEIVVHCEGGGRAGEAESILRDSGYTNVRDLTGHMRAWRDGGFPVR